MWGYVAANELTPLGSLVQQVPILRYFDALFFFLGFLQRNGAQSGYLLLIFWGLVVILS